MNRLRKGTVLIFTILFLFIIYRLFFFKTEEFSPITEDEIQSIRTEMCITISSGLPISVDTIFSLNSNMNRIYAYSFLPAGFRADTIWHKWYYGAETIKNVRCKIENLSCFSSLSVDSLREGSWSVDTRTGNNLLSVRQFKIERF